MIFRDDSRSNETQYVLTQPLTLATASGRTGSGCFHCGERCPDGRFVADEKTFCCFGCQTVFSLLQENGLAQFYELNSAPGTRIRVASSAAKWAFLDDPAVQEKLFDYADQTRARVTLHVPAIHCAACIWLLENLFKLNPDVGHSQVNFARREVTITFAPAKFKLSELATLLTSIGYEPELTLSEMDKAAPSLLEKKAWLQIGLAAFGFGNVMLMSLPVYFGLDAASAPWFRGVAGWIGLVLALPVVTFSAGDFWRAAWLALRQRTLTLEVPIVMGLSAIYLTSIIEVFAGRGPGYCDSLCGLIFFLLCGRWFQKRTYARLTFDRDYKGFFPLSVVRKDAAGESTVAISQLKTGDRLVLRNGELLPADASLLDGEAWMDYSFVTGESDPIRCAAGDHLYAGGRQVGGAIEVETIKPVAQSYLAQLWNNEAFSHKRDEDADSLSNRYSRRFTKLVVGIALAAAAFWLFKDDTKSLKVFTSVLIVACPCAIALTAPLTHGTAQRILARMGIFLKSPLVIERMAGVDTIVLDKTGTLTSADARGVGFAHAGTCLSGTEFDWIGSVARNSTHPNSVRITKSRAFTALPVRDYHETPGYGIEGEVDGRRVWIGSRLWLESLGVKISDRNAATLSSAVAINGEFRGAFVFENSLRPEVGELISQLGDQFRLVLLSGDNEHEEVRFRALFGREPELRFNQSPADKLKFIRQLQENGRKVMMVGDGLNDAGALKQADVGVAVVEQIGIFSPASDVILDARELPRLAPVAKFSRQAVKVVRMSFAISALYNVAGVSIAAAGLLSPVVCAILMPLSSITVVTFTCGMTSWLGAGMSHSSTRKQPADTGFGFIPASITALEGA